ncbi:MAG TPA: MATE family efflux transporter, partial [Thermoanaerobaculia bacterium]|nr:MATE family efflux transporter [Thermoanaerobaculia bacterium]
MLSLQPIRDEASRLVRLGLPLIGAQLAGMGAIFVDTVFSGRLGASTLAGVAIGAGIWSAVNVVLVGVLVAVQASVAHLDGAEEHTSIGPVTRQGLWIGVGLALGGILVTTHTSPLLHLMRIPSGLIPIVDGYLSALAWGIPAWCAFLLLRFMSEGIGRTRPTLYFSLVGLVVNIPADAVLMYGLLGLPALGARGCGYATALVFWAELAAMAVYVAWHPHYRHLELYRPVERPDPRQIAELLGIGVPIAVALFMEVSMFTVAALLLGSLGATVIAAHQVALNFAAISFMVPLGLSMAITVRVGNAAGRRDPLAVRRASFVGIGLALFCQVGSATVMFTLPRAIA